MSASMYRLNYESMNLPGLSSSDDFFNIKLLDRMEIVEHVFHINRDKYEELEEEFGTHPFLEFLRENMDADDELTFCISF